MNLLNVFETLVLRTGDVYLVAMRLLGYVMTLTISDFLDGFTWNFDSILFPGEGFSFQMPSLSLLQWVINLLTNFDDILGFPLFETVQSLTVFNGLFVIGVVVSAIVLIFGLAVKIAGFIIMLGS